MLGRTSSAAPLLFEHREILELSVGNLYKVITVKSLAVYVLFSSECV